MDKRLELITPRRSKAFWLTLAIAVQAALFALDVATSTGSDLIGLFAVPPFIAAVGTGRLETAVVAVLAVLLSLVAGEVDNFFGSFEHLLKVGLVGLTGLLATHVAMIRERADVSSRLDAAVARALAETGRLDNAGVRILPAISQALEWDAAALWEVDAADGTLRCTATWQSQAGKLSRFGELSAEFELGEGIGLPSRVLAGGEPVWIEDVKEDQTLPESSGAAEIGVRSAVAFPITGEGGTRAVVNLFSRRRRQTDPELMKSMATAGRYIGQHLYRRRVEGAVRRAEALRGAVLESALDCVITMNHEGRIVEFNPAAEQTFGYRRAEVVGKPVADVLIPEHLRDEHRKGLERYLSTGESNILGRRLELVGRRSNGSDFPIEVSIVRIGTEEPPIFAGYLRDLTARKRGEESARRLAAIVEHSSDAVVGVGVDGRIVAWNPGAERLYGWSAAEAIGMSIADTAPPDQRDETEYLVRRLMSGEAITNHRTQRMRKDGELVDVALTLSPIRDEGGDVIGMAGIIRDISEELEIERERVRLLEQETKARRRAEELERRASFLVEIHTALDSSLDYEVVLRRLARITVPRIADWCAIHMKGDDGAPRRLAVAHNDPKRERFAWDLEDRYPTNPDDTTGVPQVLRTGKAELYPEITDEMVEAGARDAEHLEIIRSLGLRSAMIVPLRARGQTQGAVTLVSAESGRFYTEDDLDFASAMARRAALSVDNARLHSELAERSRENEFLAAASAALDQTLDLDETLQRVADLTVPDLGDGCMVDLLEENGTVTRVASATSDEAARPVLERLRDQHINFDSAHPIAIALRTGTVQRVEDINRGMHETWASDDAYLDVVRGWPGRSAVVVPMVARGRTLGSIALASFSERTFDDDDVRVIRELARRAAFAVDNARLFGESSYIATKLQQSLLPPHLPEIPGVEIAARFRPAGETNDVGGDFYDIFMRSEDEWAITIGDVCGKGADAAAVTSLARHTLRATAMRGDDAPDELLRTLNRAMLAEGPMAYQFCTVALASFKVGSESTIATVSSGGHPLPIVLRADGTVQAFGEPGTLLGVVPDPDLTSTEMELFRGDTLVFYTDGITEARTPEGMIGFTGLLSAVRSCAGCGAAEVAERIEQHLLDSQTTELRDDVALVVAQIAVGGDGRARGAAALTADA
ncbi:MAG TPA: PAS domain S-box protein [Solirubrobacterales bacterium]|nr:PAS domain S-box protein [Solirubrobacterales bacterium]